MTLKLSGKMFLSSMIALAVVSVVMLLVARPRVELDEAVKRNGGVRVAQCVAVKFTGRAVLLSSQGEPIVRHRLANGWLWNRRMPMCRADGFGGDNDKDDKNISAGVAGELTQES